MVGITRSKVIELNIYNLCIDYPPKSFMMLVSTIISIPPATIAPQKTHRNLQPEKFPPSRSLGRGGGSIVCSILSPDSFAPVLLGLFVVCLVSTLATRKFMKPDVKAN